MKDESHLTRSCQSAQSVIRPLSEQVVGQERSGMDGSNRADEKQLQIDAQNDPQALACFLQEYEQSKGTHRIYTRECERLFLWSWLEREKPISSLDRQDFESYLIFLQNPPANWCGPKAPRETQQWRPFVGPLQQAAVMTAMASINSFLTYLVDAGYLKGNPLGLIRQRRRKFLNNVAATSTKSQTSQHTEEAHKVERYLDEDMWRCINMVVEERARTTVSQIREYERARFVLSFLYLLAPRAGDMENNNMSSFSRQHGLWWWSIIGKGDKQAKLPVPDDMIQALMRYRCHLGLSAIPKPGETTPLLCSLEDPPRPITARRINQILKSIFEDAANQMPSEHADKAELLRKASAHWGRHTAITRMLDEAGLDARLVQKAARHSDPRTTQLYIHDEERRWHEQAQKHRLKWEKSGLDPN